MKILPNINQYKGIFVSPQEFSLLLISVLTSVAGQFFLKAGALKLGKVNLNNTISHIFSIITIPELLIGLTCYGLGAVAYILLLTRVNLSVAGPSIALVYVFSVLLGYFIFKETIPLTRLIGLSSIIAGVILVVWQK
jgi:drug/metabolite transporter (DMT)-like permease